MENVRFLKGQRMKDRVTELTKCLNKTRLNIFIR